MRLSFKLPSPYDHDRMRPLFEAMASALAGRRVTFVRVEHRQGYDPNFANACFADRWIAEGEIVFTQSVETVEGNPRDGYPYIHEAVLTMPGRRLRASDSGGLFFSLQLELTRGTGEDARLLRGLLRRELGDANDGCETPWRA